VGFLRKAAGAWGTANAYRKVGGAWVPAAVWKKIGGVWVTVSNAILVTRSPATLSMVDSTATVTTGNTTVTASGGVTPYSYSWARLAGGDNIVATAPSARITAFSGSSMAVNESRAATFRCTVTDSNGMTATCDVGVTVQRVAAVGLTLDKSSIVADDDTTTVTTGTVTGTASGGTAPFAYKWTRASGSTGITITSSTSNSTTFRAATLAAGETRSGVFTLTVTDANGATDSANVTVSISRAAALSASVSPTSVSGSGSTATITSTATATASASGGSGPFSYSWTKVSGGAITPATPGSATTKFTATGTTAGESRTAVFKCTITDSVGQTAVTANVTVTITSTATTGATYTPAAGSYNASDVGSVSYTVSASVAVPWTWSATVTAGLTASLASGASGTAITFTLTTGLSDRSTTVSLQSGGKTWTLNLTVFGSSSL
jgi:hypothetical protein